MNKQGAALIFALLVVIVLSVLLGSFFLSTMSENALVKKYVNSARAFWAAEAGIADAARHLPDLSNREDCIGNNTCYNATIGSPFLHENVTYYNITSTGTVTLPSGDIIRILKAVVSADDVRNDNFYYAIASTSNITITGNAAELTGDSGCANCTGHACNCTVMNSTQCCGKIGYPSFVGLFGIEQSEMREQAIAAGRYYDNANFTSPVSNITWVEGNLTRSGASALNGTGILIVTGDADLRGNVDFNGVLYVTGKVILRGGGGYEPTFTGAIISASNTTIEEDEYLLGKVNLQRNETWIDQALNNTRLLVDKAINFWKED